MRPQVSVLQPAELEMLNAARYYELQVPGLGDAFLDKIDSATADITEHPDRWPIVRSNIRSRLIHRFPYGLLYRIDSEILRDSGRLWKCWDISVFSSIQPSRFRI